MQEGDKGDNHGLTHNQGREILGTGGVQNTHHEGPSERRPTEDRATRRENEPKKKVLKTFKRTYLDRNGKVCTETYQDWVEE